MAPQDLIARSTLLSSYNIIGSRPKVGRKRKTTRNTSQSCLRRKDGMLNAAINARLEQMQINNSLSSPLLRLPGEIRNKIWKYSVGYHKINISHHTYRGSWRVRSSYDVRPLNNDVSLPDTFVRPSFQIQRVCRQLYVETSAMIYMLNTFGFNGHKALDHWTTKRAIGQRRLITRVDIPYDYMGLYRGGFRKKLREKFPDIERIGVDIMVPYFGQRLEENSLEKAKQRVINFVEKKEGEDIKVDWYSSSMGSPL